MIYPDFKPWAKISRLNRPIIVTEKIDGTNGIIYISEDFTQVVAGSRTQWLTPEHDNYGFASWVRGHRDELLGLGAGYHYGEWWGHGIQRGYGLPAGHRRFSLFNVQRWSDEFGKDAVKRPSCCHTVPVLYNGKFDQQMIETSLTLLRLRGSQAVPFMNPEGIVVYHTHANTAFKVTLEHDEQGKSE
jgi:hypothetical protein